MNIIILSFALLVSAVSSQATGVQQSPSQDGFDVALSSAEAWAKAEASTDKDFAGEIAPRLAVIRQVYKETVRAEAEISLLLQATKKDIAWIDKALAVEKKITAIRSKLPLVSGEKFMGHGQDEIQMHLVKVYCYAYEQVLFMRSMKSSLILFENMSQVLEEEDPRGKKEAKL